jgi:putative acetyltransferase
MRDRPEVAIVDERDGDAATIRAVTLAAFADKPYSRQTEAAIVDALRGAGALTVSLVAAEGGEILGHAAFSPVSIDGDAMRGWYGLGPISVRPDRQGGGIGSRLVREGLARLKAMGARGCVLLGDPRYYGRFGFRAYPQLVLPGLPPEYFQALPLGGDVPAGTVAYHAGFDASDD